MFILSISFVCGFAARAEELRVHSKEPAGSGEAFRYLGPVPVHPSVGPRKQMFQLMVIQPPGAGRVTASSRTQHIFCRFLPANCDGLHNVSLDSVSLAVADDSG